jgi:hypothetical protein
MWMVLIIIASLIAQQKRREAAGSPWNTLLVINAWTVPRVIALVGMP